MKHVVIVGGGIVGATASYYVARSGYRVTVCDSGVGQATAAAAGLICPWLSQRRNKDWYALAAAGAAFYHQLLRHLADDDISTAFYRQSGAIILKKTIALSERLLALAQERRRAAPEMGTVRALQAEQWRDLLPLLHTDQSGCWVSGGAVIDGQQYVATIRAAGEQRYGVTWLPQRVRSLTVDAQKPIVHLANQELTADTVILATGAWLPQLLEPLGYHVAVRPQKGQLLACQLSQPNQPNWPVVMPQHELDLLPHPDGRWFIGASHENDKGFDVQPDESLCLAMKQAASAWIPDLAQASLCDIRVGTRAYTPDFAPFFGALIDQPQVLVASGLGSSGLTTGPYIAYLLSLMVQHKPLPLNPQSYPVSRYITR